MLVRLKVGRPARVIAADGRPLTHKNLPSCDGVRWNRQRKAEVVAAVRGNLLTLDEAMRRYRLSQVEFLAWEQELLAFLAARSRAEVRREFRLLRRQATRSALRRVHAG